MQPPALSTPWPPAIAASPDAPCPPEAVALAAVASVFASYPDWFPLPAEVRAWNALLHGNLVRQLRLHFAAAGWGGDPRAESAQPESDLAIGHRTPAFARDDPAQGNADRSDARAPLRLPESDAQPPHVEAQPSNQVTPATGAPEIVTDAVRFHDDAIQVASRAPTSHAVTPLETGDLTSANIVHEHAPPPACHQPMHGAEHPVAYRPLEPCPGASVPANPESRCAVPPNLAENGTGADRAPLDPVHEHPPRGPHGAPPEVAPGAGDLIGHLIDDAFCALVGGGRSVAGDALATQPFTPAERRPCPVDPFASRALPPMAVATSSKNGKANAFRRSGSGSPISRGIVA